MCLSDARFFLLALFCFGLFVLYFIFKFVCELLKIGPSQRQGYRPR